MPAIDRGEAKRYLSNFDFTGFFSELLGWNRPPRSVPLVKQVGIQSFSFSLVAEKKGYAVLLCESIPSYQDRAKLDRLIARDYFEHILIFLDRSSKKQLWQVSLREKGRGVRLREVHLSASGEELLQKLEHIIVPLEKEETTHLTDIHAGVKAAFDVEKVTKRFFKQFELEHEGFAKFLKGIPATTKPWYVSVLINRLMFLYFMQAKRFLNDDPHYLTAKLSESTARAKDTFYRDFLCPLFFQGFALRDSERTTSVKKLLGDIPYLNGGLFQRHPLEIEHGGSITIPDSAFEKLFTFFGKWTWHLDQRTSADGDEIDPDVLGYIFEKYINNKDLGAYYTKEDITGYIAQNTVLPFLFEAARKDCANAFKVDGVVWRLLTEDPDQYIYEAMRRGNQSTSQVQRLELPPDISAGLEDVAQRSGWNRNLPEELGEFALPTETWREFIARRRRYDELRARIETGGVYEVNDLVTFNLDIRKLALDAIRYAGSEDLVESFYKAIESVTILDPTCGSGAFLFAALEILEPLYEACLHRMEQFITEAKAEAASTGVKLHFNRFAHFRKTLAAAAKHVNQEYFILKTIIVNNLYGVDIMEEATEICKLRLFLKLVAQIDPKHKDRIEPLPDIDFNIRAGNTLVGYARYSDVKNAVEAKLAFDDPMSRINDKLATLDQAVEQFRLQQTELGGSVTAADKSELNRKFVELEVELDDFLAGESGVKKNAHSTWKTKTKPFHWFCAFHSILQRGGFDIIIGNPPYIELKEIKDYDLRGYACLDCGNLYAVTMERCMAIASSEGRSGFIVPVSSISTDRYQSLQVLLNRKRHWAFGSFDDRPSRLFDGLEHIRLTIHVFENAEGAKGSRFSTRYNKWASVARPTLLDALVFEDSRAAIVAGTMPKLSAHIEQSICNKLVGDGTQLALASSGRGPNKVFYSRKVGYFLQVLDFEPTVLDGKGNRRPPSEFKTLSFHNREEASAALCALNSSLFYWFITVFSDCRHVNKREVDTLPFNARKAARLFGEEFETLGASLMKSLTDTSEMRKMKFSHDTLTVQCIFPKRSKLIIDQIDRVLAKHYGFTDDELDFIINYDIKYRMGTDSGDAEVDG